MRANHNLFLLAGPKHSLLANKWLALSCLSHPWTLFNGLLLCMDLVLQQKPLVRMHLPKYRLVVGLLLSLSISSLLAMGKRLIRLSDGRERRLSRLGLVVRSHRLSRSTFPAIALVKLRP